MGEVKHTEWEPVAEAVMASFQPHAEKLARRFSERLYEDFLGAVQDYLTDNVTFNIGQRIEAAERGRRDQWDRANAAEARVYELLAVLRSTRQTILGLKNARWSEAEGSDEEWVAEINAAIARATGSDQ